MFLDYLGSVILFAVMSLGLGWPIATRCGFRAAETIVAAVGLSLLVVFVGAWGIYVFDLSIRWLWLLPLFAVAGLITHRASIVAVGREAEARALLCSYVLVAASALVWLALVTYYSGGGWFGDWLEHWERARFFMERWEPSARMFGNYPVPARPPLENVVVGVLLVISRFDFPHYQFFMTLLASLAFLPAALFARRFAGVSGSQRPVAVLAVLFLVNPLFIENAVFAWTKLPAAFFVLSAVYFFLRTREPDAPPAAPWLFVLLLGAGMITHYSAGPYLVLLAAWWFVAGRRHWHLREWQNQTLLLGGVGALVLAMWFAWSLATYGPDVTFLSNTSVTFARVETMDPFTRIGLNLYDTIIPHFLRTFDTTLIAQTSRWGQVRDWFFQGYQLNLFLAFGSLGWLLVLYELRRARRDAPRTAWTFWKSFIVVGILLGLAVPGGRDTWGLTHLCLQPIILLGLTMLAAHWESRGSLWRRLLIAGAAIDFLFGIALHFAVQNHETYRALSGAPTSEAAIVSLNEVSIMNFMAKSNGHLGFLRDAWQLPAPLLFALAVGLLALAVWRARAEEAPVPSPTTSPRTEIQPA